MIIDDLQFVLVAGAGVLLGSSTQFFAVTPVKPDYCKLYQPVIAERAPEAPWRPVKAPNGVAWPQEARLVLPYVTDIASVVEKAEPPAEKHVEDEHVSAEPKRIRRRHYRHRRRR